MAVDPSGYLAGHDLSALAGHDDGGLHLAAPKPNGDKGSPGVLSRASVELLNAVGFVAMFAAIGGLIPALATGTFAAGVAATIGVGFAFGVTAMLTSAFIKKRIEDKAEQKKASQEPPVVIQTLELHPHLETDRGVDYFTRRLEEERAQHASSQLTRQ